MNSIMNSVYRLIKMLVMEEGHGFSTNKHTITVIDFLIVSNSASYTKIINNSKSEILYGLCLPIIPLSFSLYL